MYVLSPTAPGPVSNIQWVPLSASSVNVSWSPPQRPNGIILGYSVVLERYEDGLVINSIDVDNSVFTVPFTDGAALGKMCVLHPIANVIKVFL